MITELTFARSYSNFWEDIFPGAYHFIRLLNKGAYTERVHLPIEIEDIPRRRALINNIAFELFNKNWSKEIDNKTIASLTLDNSILQAIETKEKEYLTKRKLGENLELAVSDNELKIIKEMAKRLNNEYKTNSVVVYPEFKGAGLLFNTQGDVYYNETLVEIKARGDRSFSILDIRQLFIYGALNYLNNNEYTITNFELFNPRVGIYWHDTVENIAYELSNTSSVDIYNEIINYLTNNYSSL